MHNVPENREFPRLAVDCGITYRCPDEPHTRSAVVRNISSTGVLFIAEEEPVIGSVLEIKVNPGNMSIPPLSAVVEVVRVSPGLDSRWSAGVSSGYATSLAPDSGAVPCFEVAARIMSVK